MAETAPSSSNNESRVHVASAAADKKLIDFRDSDVILGLVGPVGTEWGDVTDPLKDCFQSAGYSWSEVRVSSDVIARLTKVNATTEAKRIEAYMEAGNNARKKDTGILADGIAAAIAEKRAQERTVARRAFVVNSLKHPDEVMRLRRIYGSGFYLIGVQPDEVIKREFLARKMVDLEINHLIKRDEDDQLPYGQRVNDTFHLADFFVRIDGDKRTLNGSLRRICEILFGYPYSTPTFDEFAMFLAFAASLRSADLSRQVGAVVARNENILATGANDTPRFGGGLYWPEFDENEHRFTDKLGTRDYRRGRDSNREEQDRIIREIVAAAAAKDKDLNASILKDVLDKSSIRDLTEYGRVVHAEMEALLSCARNGTSPAEATLFCTTFPCHNCAKHIIAAGIARVVFIEPYRKSKAAEFHPDAITVGPGKIGPEVGVKPPVNTVRFEPFVGVGPRRFFDLFSMRLGIGRELKRKDETGAALSWSLSKDEALRVQMRPGSYLDLEKEAQSRFDQAVVEGGNQG